MVETEPKAHAQPTAPIRKRNWRVLILLGILIIALIGYVIWAIVHSQEEARNRYRVFVSGRIEGYETNLAPKIGGLIEWISVREGNVVKAGQQLAQLADADYQAQLKGATARIGKAEQILQQDKDQLLVVQAQVNQAQRRFAQAGLETRGNIAAAEANVAQGQAKYIQTKADHAQALAELELARIRLERYTNLVKRGAVTKDDYDQARTTFQNDTDTVKSRAAAEVAAKETVASLQAQLTTARSAVYNPPIRVKDIDVAQAQLQQAQHTVEGAQQDLKNAIAERDQVLANIAYLKIISPINGVVIARPVEPGAVLAPGQTILTVVNLDNVYMRGFVPDSEVGKLRLGQRVDVYLDAMPKTAFEGELIEVDPQASFTPENIYFKSDRVKQVFGIKVAIKKPGGYCKPGMPADSSILLR